MAGMCFGETETSTTVEPSLRASRRRRLDVHQFMFPAGEAVGALIEPGRKRQKLELLLPATPISVNGGQVVENGVSEKSALNRCETPPVTETASTTTSSAGRYREAVEEVVEFGMTSVCGRRRDMEDSVAIHPSFTRRNQQDPSNLHFFGVYDGHGCSHVAMKCKDRMHEILKDEINGDEEAPPPWKEVMEKSFSKMDKEVTDYCNGVSVPRSNCRCELQTPQCDAVGSTAVVAVVSRDKIVVSNCGDSRAVLCRNGVAIPLSSDHKPDRPDELARIEDSGGRVIYWDGPRVLGVLAMSRAIGDNYLKPYVIPEPEVTVTERTAEDECLILASDGLWDVVSNETACSVARMCLQAQRPSPSPPPPPHSPGSTVPDTAGGESTDKACSDASILLTKLALARHSTDNVSVVVVNLRKGL